MEIITLSGYVTSTESHLRISVSDNNCDVFGCHLLPRIIVLKSGDVLLGVFADLNQKTITRANDSPSIIDIYILPDCSWSKRYLLLLYSYNYNSHLLSNDVDFKKVNKRTSFNTFPQIFIKNEFIGGYSEPVDLSTNGDLINLIS